MNYKLVFNPKEKYYKRYRAVLLLNGGMSKGYPHDMKMDDIMKSVYNEVSTHSDGTLELVYNDKG